jgi:hypothetical protein
VLVHSVLLAWIGEPAALTNLSGSLADFRFTQGNPGATVFAAGDLELKERPDAHPVGSRESPP